MLRPGVRALLVAAHVLHAEGGLGHHLALPPGCAGEAVLPRLAGLEPRALPRYIAVIWVAFFSGCQRCGQVRWHVFDLMLVAFDVAVTIVQYRKL